MVRVSINGQPPVELVPYVRYRIGSRSYMEFYIDHESIEGYHGVFDCEPDCVYVIKLLGQTFVNGKEVEVQKLTSESAGEDGLVKLRFGEVEAEMYFDSDSTNDEDTTLTEASVLTKDIKKKLDCSKHEK
ncbi:uncharacterized protein LOC115626770 [Scaptodrosophila lebanonensis]|uniref:Uncharacterized protein LOC115626770 n=1 Tax=Drosophila lebanonensis TaxID=7225 RepID=A0A6J2TSH3_DROLE|nr:uncharacterized protein LOC115626770 [Scaptodrosophila lebanonensis]